MREPEEIEDEEHEQDPGVGLRGWCGQGVRHGVAARCGRRAPPPAESWSDRQLNSPVSQLNSPVTRIADLPTSCSTWRA